jgi:hypothetical protein
MAANTAGSKTFESCENRRTCSDAFPFHQGLETQHPLLARVGFVLSGAWLPLSMHQAPGFGLRDVLPDFALTTPPMWTVHGTLNALGFGRCGILAWRGC